MFKIAKSNLVAMSIATVIGFSYLGISYYNSSISETIFNDFVKDANILNGNLINSSIEYDKGLFGSTASTKWLSPAGIVIDLSHEISHGIMGIEIMTTLDKNSELRNDFSESQLNPFEEPFQAKTVINTLNQNQRTSFFVSDLSDDKATLVGFNGFFKVVNGDVKAKISIPSMKYTSGLKNVSIDNLSVSLQANAIDGEVKSSVTNSSFKNIYFSNSAQKIDLNLFAMTLSTSSDLGRTELTIDSSLGESIVKAPMLDVSSSNIEVIAKSDFSDSVLDYYYSTSKETEESKIAEGSQKMFNEIIRDLNILVSNLSYSGRLNDVPYFGSGSADLNISASDKYSFNTFALEGMEGLYKYTSGNISGDFSRNLIGGYLPRSLARKIIGSSEPSDKGEDNLKFKVKLIKE